MWQLYYTVHCYYMGDLIGQEKCLERSLQASLVSVVSGEARLLLQAKGSGSERVLTVGVVSQRRAAGSRRTRLLAWPADMGLRTCSTSSLSHDRRLTRGVRHCRC